jgi:hypothetical protein
MATKIKTTTPEPNRDFGPLRIVVLTGGWVFIGRVRYDSTQGYEAIIVDNADCIRTWGTTQGLGQLAIEGVQKETVLDPTGKIAAPLSSLIATIEVDESKWKNR